MQRRPSPVRSPSILKKSEGLSGSPGGKALGYVGYHGLTLLDGVWSPARNSDQPGKGGEVKKQNFAIGGMS